MNRAFIAKIIKYSPNNTLRIFLYKTFLKYEIGENVKIGKSFILCNKVTIANNSKIGDNTYIVCRNFSMGYNSKINSGNVLMGNNSFTMGNNSRIINDHYFDLTNNISLGNNSWIAGRNSQFWTHGSIHTKLKIKDLSIKIGDDVYVGSKVSFAAGVEVKSLNLIGLGSVLSKSILDSRNIIVGNPAKIVKKEIDWRENW